MLKLSILAFFLVLSASLAAENFCKDWTIWTLCYRLQCGFHTKSCPEDKPYLLYAQCGCCQYCSETPRIGPCGECGKDVVCETETPQCHYHAIVSLDHCGCCRMCKAIVEVGGVCENDPEKPSSTVCAPGLQCFHGQCMRPSVNNFRSKLSM